MRYKIDVVFSDGTRMTKITRKIPSEMAAHCVCECIADRFEEQGYEVVLATYTPYVLLKRKAKSITTG